MERRAKRARRAGPRDLREDAKRLWAMGEDLARVEAVLRESVEAAAAAGKGGAGSGGASTEPVGEDDEWKKSVDV